MRSVLPISRFLVTSGLLVAGSLPVHGQSLLEGDELRSGMSLGRVERFFDPVSVRPLGGGVFRAKLRQPGGLPASYLMAISPKAGLCVYSITYSFPDPALAVSVFSDLAAIFTRRLGPPSPGGDSDSSRRWRDLAAGRFGYKDVFLSGTSLDVRMVVRYPDPGLACPVTGNWESFGGPGS